MGKTLPVAYTGTQAGMGAYGTGSAIEAADYTDIISSQHYHWAHTGAHVGGLTFDAAYDGIFETASATYTQTNATGTVDLDNWHAISEGLRIVEDASNLDRVAWTLQVYAKEAHVRLTVTNEAGTSLGTATTSHTAGTFEWQTAHVLVNPTGIDRVYMYLEVKKDDSANAQMLCFHVHEEVVTQTPSSSGAIIPTGAAVLFHVALDSYLTAQGVPATSIWTMDEASGSLVDYKGAHNLAASGNPVYGGASLANDSGNSIALDGTGDEFSKTTTALAPGAGVSATVLGIFAPSASVATRALLGHGIDTLWYALEIDATDHLRLLVDDNSVQVNCIATTTGNFGAGAALYAGVMDRTANLLRANKDGVDIKTQAWTTELTIAGTGAFRVGGKAVGSSSLFLGDVDVCAYIPYALTNTQLLAITALAGL